MSEGAGSYFGFGYDVARGVPGTILNYIPFMSESFDFKPELKENPNTTPRGARLKGRLTGMSGKGNLKGVPDSESLARMRAHHQGKVVTSNPVATVYQHVLTQLLRSDADPATYRKTLSGVVYRDDDRPQRMMGGKVSAVTIDIKGADYVMVTHDINWENRSRAGDPIEVVVNAAMTGDLKVRGVRRDPAAASSTANDIYIQATTAGTGLMDGSTLFKMKKGLATVYGATTYALLANSWFVIYDELNAIMGASIFNPLQGYFTFPAGAIITALDEWRIPARGTEVVPTYTTRDVYSGAQVTATIGGLSYELKGITIKGTFPRAEIDQIGTIFSKVDDNGKVLWDIDVDRSYDNADFVDAMESGATAAVSVLMQGDVIGATIYRDQWKLEFPNCQYNDAGTNVANAGQNQEKISLMAYDNGSASICTETLINTIATI